MVVGEEGVVVSEVGGQLGWWESGGIGRRVLLVVMRWVGGVVLMLLEMMLEVG